MGTDNRKWQKLSAAKAAAVYVRDKMTIGIGTGSTVYYLIQEIGEKIKAGYNIRAVVTSKSSRELALSRNIPVCLPEEAKRIDLAIDGVDEIDRDFCAVKGGGGALMREKIVAVKAEEVIWIMDESKPAERLGCFPLPVEVLPFGYSWTADGIRKIGGQPILRKKNGDIYCTDNGNYILDVTFGKETDYRQAASAIRAIPGVLETGYFDSICSRIIIGTDAGAIERVNSFRKEAFRESRCDR